MKEKGPRTPSEEQEKRYLKELIGEYDGVMRLKEILICETPSTTQNQRLLYLEKLKDKYGETIRLREIMEYELP